jgi:retron-type reverse transcriptase
VDNGVFHKTDTGTGQGAVVSPLLANIALHGMEDALGVTHGARGEICGKRAVVGYADDFCVFCESKEDAEAVVGILERWLALRGLTLSLVKGTGVEDPPHLLARVMGLPINIVIAATISALTLSGWLLDRRFRTSQS